MNWLDILEVNEEKRKYIHRTIIVRNPSIDKLKEYKSKMEEWTGKLYGLGDKLTNDNFEMIERMTNTLEHYASSWRSIYWDLKRMGYNEDELGLKEKVEPTDYERVFSDIQQNKIDF